MSEVWDKINYKNISKIYLTSSFSLSMLPSDKGSEIVVLPLEHDDARDILLLNKPILVPAIGHQTTAEIVSRLLGGEIPPQANRIQIKLTKEDVVVVFQLLQRLPEGYVVKSTRELEKLPHKWFLVTFRENYLGDLKSYKEKVPTEEEIKKLPNKMKEEVVPIDEWDYTVSNQDEVIPGPGEQVDVAESHRWVVLRPKIPEEIKSRGLPKVPTEWYDRKLKELKILEDWNAICDYADDGIPEAEKWQEYLFRLKNKEFKKVRFTIADKEKAVEEFKKTEVYQRLQKFNRSKFNEDTEIYVEDIVMTFPSDASF